MTRTRSSSHAAAQLFSMRRDVGGMLWQLSGTDLVLVRLGAGDRAWGLGYRHANQAASMWLKQHGLHAATFASRTDAVRALRAAHAIDPVPDALHPPVVLRRRAAGEHHTADGRFTVIRQPHDREGRWEVNDTNTGSRLRVSYLHDAAVLIAMGLDAERRARP